MDEPEIWIYRNMSPAPRGCQKGRPVPRDFSYYCETITLPADEVGSSEGCQAHRVYCCIAGSHYTLEPLPGMSVAVRTGICDGKTCRDGRPWDKEWDSFAYDDLREVKLAAQLPLPWWDPFRQFFRTLLNS